MPLLWRFAKYYSIVRRNLSSNDVWLWNPHRARLISSLCRGWPPVLSGDQRSLGEVLGLLVSHTISPSNTDGILPSYLHKLRHLRFVSTDDNASVAAVSVTGAGVVHVERRAASECHSQSFAPLQTGKTSRSCPGPRRYPQGQAGCRSKREYKPA